MIFIYITDTRHRMRWHRSSCYLLLSLSEKKEYKEIRAFNKDLTLTLVTNPWSCNTCAVEVTATIHITLHSAQHQSGRV